MIHVFYGVANIDGKEYYVRFTVQRKKNESGLHSSFVSSVELYDKNNPAMAASGPSSNGGRKLDYDRITDAKLKIYFDKCKENGVKVSEIFNSRTASEGQTSSEARMREVLDEMKRRRGYDSDTSYQGSKAFNGAAPSRNAYFETKEERKQAFEDGDFEGDYSLGDFMGSGLDGHDLGWQINHPQAASHGDRATMESIRNIAGVVKGGKPTIKVYRAVDASINEGSFRNGDWVTPSRQYAEQHIGLQDWKSGRIIEQEVSVDDLWWDGNDINEWGYDDGKGYAYKNTRNNRKLDDLVTSDDKGRVIPPSKRFNERKSDVRFSFVEEPDKNLTADEIRERARRMSDTALLRRMNRADDHLENRRMMVDAYAEEYDRRHQEEYDQSLESYGESLAQMKDLDDCYSMQGDLMRRWREGGHSSEERTKLMAQMDALSVRIDELEDETLDAEALDFSPETLDVSRQQTGAPGRTETTPARTETEAQAGKPESLPRGASGTDETFVLTGAPEPKKGKAEGDEKKAGRYVGKRGKAVTFQQLTLDFKDDAEKDTLDFSPETLDVSQPQSAPLARLPRLRRGEVCYVERKFEEDGTFSLSGRGSRVESVEDVAYIFRCLEDRSVEHSFLVLVDKEGNPTIVHTGMGTPVNTMVDSSCLNALLGKGKWSHVYFVHNHPSGNLRPSNPDRLTAATVYIQCLKYLVPMKSLIIDTYKHQFLMFDGPDSERFDMPEGRGADTPITLHKFDAMSFSPDFKPQKITSSTDVVNVVNSLRLGARDKIGYVVMNNDGVVTGAFYTGASTAEELNNDKVVQEVARNTTLAGGRSVIFFGTGLEDSNGGKTLMGVRKLVVDTLGLGNNSVLDFVRIGKDGDYKHQYKYIESARDRGVMEPEGDEYAGVVRDEGEDVETVNKRFNEDLTLYKEGRLPRGYRFDLGMPSEYLESAGFDSLPISMRASLLARKAGDESHPFDASDLRDMVKAMQKPIAIFKYTKDNIRNLVIDVSRGDKHFLVGVTLNYNADGIEINSVSGLFPKESHEWIKWIQDGKAIRIDQKDKVQDLISSLRTNPAESARIGLDLNRAAKIVEDFENPKLSGENLSEDTVGSTGKCKIMKYV